MRRFIVTLWYRLRGGAPDDWLAICDDCQQFKCRCPVIQRIRSWWWAL